MSRQPFFLAAAVLLLSVGVAGVGASDVWAYHREWVWSQPWRFWTAALVHTDFAHAGRNTLAALVLLGLFWRWPLARGSAWALLLAWPLTHAMLWCWPQVAHMRGASGLAHAVAAVWLVSQLARSHAPAVPAAPRLVAGTVLGLLVAKLAAESWYRGAIGAPLGRPDGAPVVFAVHLTGVVAGLFAVALVKTPWLSALSRLRKIKF